MPSRAEIAAEIARQVDQRGAGKTICPSEVARALGGDDWRDLMAPVRAVAGEMAAEGRIVVSQGGETVKIDEATGPVRLGLPS